MPTEPKLEYNYHFNLKLFARLFVRSTFQVLVSMHFLHVLFCTVSIWETELRLTCLLRFGQNGKTPLPLVTTHQDLFSRNVLGLAMRMLPPQKRYHLRSTGGLTVLARIEIVATLVHYQVGSINHITTLHTHKETQ